MDDNHLHILWTNADPTVFDKMVLMYAVNSLVRGWWEKVTVILWGDTAALAAHDQAVKERIALAMEQGVAFSACVLPAPGSWAWSRPCGIWAWRLSPGGRLLPI